MSILGAFIVPHPPLLFRRLDEEMKRRYKRQSTAIMK